ncbi:MAG: electron transport complex subunit RsxC [Desulfobacterales bacterium]|nr:electron transport complex subunit RsxC [Desulfobacterales bacterium]
MKTTVLNIAKLLTFQKGGINPPEKMRLTKNLPIEVMPTPPEVAIFLKQHVGTACLEHCIRADMCLHFVRQPTDNACKIVFKGLQNTLYSEDYFLNDNICFNSSEVHVQQEEKVSEGDLIGKGSKLGSNLHASISGLVKTISDTPHPFGKEPAIVLSIDPDAKPKSYPIVNENWMSLSREDLFAKIKEAGIVGLGGAGIPIDSKLSVKRDSKLDTLILNSESEPYLTSNYRIMLEHAFEIIEGAKILLTILDIKECIIGVENNKPDAIIALNQAIENDTQKNGSKNQFKIVVQPLQTKYPQDATDQITFTLTGRIKPTGKRISASGVNIQNVYTAKVIYDAVVCHKPFYEKVITVSGRGIARPANLLVKIGTRLRDIVDYLGGMTQDVAKIVIGGPMLGFAVSSLEIPITKTTPGVLFLTQDEIDIQPSYDPCIRCGFCLQACPMGLEPNNVSIYVEAGKSADTEQFGIMEDCFECGCCAYVCPSKRPLVQFIKLAKLKILEAQQKKKQRESKPKESKQREST